MYKKYKKITSIILIFALIFVNLLLISGITHAIGNEKTVSSTVYDDDSSLNEPPPYVEPSPSVSLQISVSPTTYNPGDEITYTFKVKNTGDIKLVDLILTSYNISGLNHTVGSLDVGEEKIITFSSLVHYYWIKDTIVKAFINGTDYCHDFHVSDESSVNLNIKAMEFSKSVSPSSVFPGQMVTYEFKIKNLCTLPLAQVSITDPMIQEDLNSVVQSPFNIPAKGEKIIYVNHNVPFESTPETVINTATVNGLLDNEIPLFMEDSAEYTILEINPNIEIIKEASSSQLKKGDIATYTFKIKNTGNITLYDVEVTDPMFGDEWQYFVSSLSPDESNEFTHDYTILDDTPDGDITNTAFVIAKYGPDNIHSISASDDATINIGITPIKKKKKPRINLFKSVNPTTALPGDDVTYKFKVKNVGKTPLYDVVVTDPLFGDDWSYEIGELQRYGEKEFDVAYKVPADAKEGTFKNIALVESMYKNRIVSDKSMAILTIGKMPVKPDPIPDPIPDPVPNPIPDPVPEPEPTPEPVPDLPFTGGVVEVELLGASFGGLLALYSVFRRKR